MYWWVKMGYPDEFDMGDDCFPLSGQVIRYYREQKKDENGKMVYSRPRFAKAIDVSDRTVASYENENLEPDSKIRRDLICKLLGIPAILLGGITIEDILLQLKKGGNDDETPDLDEHQAYLARIKEQYRMGSSRGIVESNNLRIQSLNNALKHTSGQQIDTIRDLLFEYHILSSGAVAQRSISSSHLALMHANLAMEAATTIELKVVSMLQIGDLYKSQGHIQDSLTTFECAMEAIKEAEVDGEEMPDYLKGVALLYSGTLRARMATDYADQRNAISALEQAGRMVCTLPSASFPHGFDYSWQKFQLREAEMHIYLGAPQRALYTLRDLKCNPVGWWQLQQNLLEAQAYINLNDYQSAVWYLDAALSTIKKFDSDYITPANNLYKQIVASPYAASPSGKSDVRYLKERIGPVHAAYN